MESPAGTAQSRVLRLACRSLGNSTMPSSAKASKNRKPATWDFGKDLPTVNAEYLLDMLELLPGCTATVSESRPIHSTIYFQAEGVGEGCLCPTRKES